MIRWLLSSASIWALLPAIASAACPTVIGKGRGRYHITAKDESAALPWMKEEYKRRALLYFKYAHDMYRIGLMQQKGKDPKQRDPYIKVYNAQTQILAGIDLDPENPRVWLEGGKAALALSDLDDGGTLGELANGLFAKACTLDRELLDELTAWLKESRPKKIKHGDKDLPTASLESRKSSLKSVRKWKKDKIPVLPIDLLSEDTEHDHQGGCRDIGDAKMIAFQESLQGKQFFATHLLVTNVNKHAPDGFCDRLADIVVKRHEKFLQEQQGNNSLADVHDSFVDWQTLDESQMDSSDAHQKWPELYRDSEDWKFLRKLQKASLRNYANRMGLMPPQQDVKSSVWAAVHPGTTEGQTGQPRQYFSNRDSVVSCILYCRAPGSTGGPTVFVDPRSQSPMDDYSVHRNDGDFEPPAPFHRSEYVFPEKGDHICFPSWLVHTAPSQSETDVRVAFPSKMAFDSSRWDTLLSTSGHD